MPVAAAAFVPPADTYPSPALGGFAVAFTPAPERVAHMRRITSAHLRRWQVGGSLADDIVLVVSELVTNAVQHSGGSPSVELRLHCGNGELRVEVADGSRARPRLRLAAPDEVSGRGLLLVAALAQSWSVSEDGRTTQCIFRFPPGRTAPEGPLALSCLHRPRDEPPTTQ